MSDTPIYDLCVRRARESSPVFDRVLAKHRLIATLRRVREVLAERFRHHQEGTA